MTAPFFSLPVKIECLMVEARHNKAEAAIELEFSFEDKGYVEVTMLDENGNLAYSYHRFHSSSKRSHCIPSDQLHGQVYLLRVAFNGDTVINEVIELT